MSNTGKIPLTIDIARYEHFLQNSNLNQVEKEQWLNDLWSVICSFIQMGCEVQPIQQVKQSCGKEEETFSASAQGDSLGVELETVIEAFATACDEKGK